MADVMLSFLESIALAWKLTCVGDLCNLITLEAVPLLVASLPHKLHSWSAKSTVGMFGFLLR